MNNLADTGFKRIAEISQFVLRSMHTVFVLCFIYELYEEFPTESLGVFTLIVYGALLASGKLFPITWLPQCQWSDH